MRFAFLLLLAISLISSALASPTPRKAKAILELPQDSPFGTAIAAFTAGQGGEEEPEIEHDGPGEGGDDEGKEGDGAREHPESSSRAFKSTRLGEFRAKLPKIEFTLAA
jgi:hypothetical protein